MASIVRSTPFDELFKARAEYKDGVLNLALPKKPNGSAQRIAVS